MPDKDQDKAYFFAGDRHFPLAMSYVKPGASGMMR